MYFVIKNPKEGYYTEMQIVESKPILAPTDLQLHQSAPPVKKGEQIGVEDIYRPLFEAFKPSQASHFGTEQDCLDLMANKEFGAPDSFAGCIAEQVDG